MQLTEEEGYFIDNRVNSVCEITNVARLESRQFRQFCQFKF